MKAFKSPLLVMAAMIFTFSAAALQAQGTNVLQGRIYDGTTSKPVNFAVIVAREAGMVSNTGQNGAYRLELPAPGNYTITIRSAGLNDLVTIMAVEGTVTRDFTLNRTIADTGKTRKGGAVTVRGDRDIQTISRQTMTVKEIKEVPASFGDSITALSSLPGINRAGSFFGPLIIRGADEATNGYYIDGIPLFKVMHFGGIHSVIANDLMSSIDVYSSAFPAQFVGPQGAVININTVDEVKQEGGFADMGFISANALVQMPITKTAYLEGKEVKENRGYVIASGRYGYMSLFIPAFYKYVMNQDLSWLPKYWDYQFKTRYDFNKQNSLTLLAFGSKDQIDLEIKESWIDPADDPLLAGMQMYQNDQAHSQGLTYRYHYSDRLNNSLMAFSTLNQSNMWWNVPGSSASWAHNLGIKSTPYIFGLKDSLFMEWWKDHCTLRAGGEARYYLFKTAGNTIRTTSDDTDLGDEDDIELIKLGQTYRNKTLSGYAENKFLLGGLTFVPGVAGEYLERGSNGFIDPRAMVSYTFRSGTTIGAAGGYYSMFIQTMPEYFTILPNLAGTDFGPQKSIHRSLSVEQKLDVYTFKVEGFYNNFWKMVVEDANSDGTGCYTNRGKMWSGGVELLAKISDEKDQGLFGWVSYTYNRARYITHQSAEYTDYGEKWLTSPYDMTHVLKLVAGYTYGKNTLSCKFQYNTATPYTAITGGTQDPNYTDPSDASHQRWVPVYGKPYTERLTPDYRLDVRYSRKLNYKWGYVSWYIELIGIVQSTPQEYKWDYRYSYSSGNPKVVNQDNSLSFIPNFGVEVKF
jgi:hypothetical protein